MHFGPTLQHHNFRNLVNVHRVNNLTRQHSTVLYLDRVKGQQLAGAIWCICLCSIHRELSVWILTNKCLLLTLYCVSDHIYENLEQINDGTHIKDKLRSNVTCWVLYVSDRFRKWCVIWCRTASSALLMLPKWRPNQSVIQHYIQTQPIQTPSIVFFMDAQHLIMTVVFIFVLGSVIYTISNVLLCLGLSFYSFMFLRLHKPNSRKKFMNHFPHSLKAFACLIILLLIISTMCVSWCSTAPFALWVFSRRSLDQSIVTIVFPRHHKRNSSKHLTQTFSSLTHISLFICSWNCRISLQLPALL